MCGMHVCVMWDNKLVRGFLSSLTSDSTAARVQGARSTFSSSVNHFFTRLLLNGITHGESCSYTRSQALTNMLTYIAFVCANILTGTLRSLFCIIRSGVLLLFTIIAKRQLLPLLPFLSLLSCKCLFRWYNFFISNYGSLIKNCMDNIFILKLDN